MRTSFLLLVAAGVLPSPAVGQEADGVGGVAHPPAGWPQPIPRLTAPTSPPAVDTLSVEVAQSVVAGTCMRCHNPRRVSGGMSLETFEVTSASDNAVIAERMVRKLRAGMMPPVGVRRPTPDSLRTLAAVLESRLDAAWEANPNPGRRTFQRLNRAEYSRSIYDLLDLDIDAGDYLPLDTKSANFDNIADVQLLSPTLMDGYLRAASEISRLAVGDPEVTPSEATFRVSRWTSQAEHVEGTPYGSRGGVAVDHNFPADGEYAFRVSFHHETTGALFGNGKGALHTTDEPERIEISVDGARVALLDIDRWMHVSDPDGVNLRTDPVFIEAGPHRVAAAFIRTFEGAVAGPDVSARLVDREHEHHGRVRVHDAAAPAGPRGDGALRPGGHVLDAEPRAGALVPSLHAGGGGPVRGSHPLAAGDEGLPPAADG